MTMPIKFDTLEYVKRLTEAGISPEQATAQAQALSAALSEGTVTPAEIVVLKAEVTARIDTVKAEIFARIDAFKTESFARIDAFKTEICARIDASKTESCARIDAIDIRADALKHDLEVFKASVNTKFTTLFWLVGLALALQAGQVGALIYIIGRLP